MPGTRHYDWQILRFSMHMHIAYGYMQWSRMHMHIAYMHMQSFEKVCIQFAYCIFFLQIIISRKEQYSFNTVYHRHFKNPFIYSRFIIHYHFANLQKKINSNFFQIISIHFNHIPFLCFLQTIDIFNFGQWRLMKILF